MKIYSKIKSTRTHIVCFINNVRLTSSLNINQMRIRTVLKENLNYKNNRNHFIRIC